MREHPDTGLIIIDTLKRVREAGGADYSYASDYDVVARLKALADSYKVSMLIVHHTRKQKSEDIFPDCFRNEESTQTLHFSMNRLIICFGSM